MKGGKTRKPEAGRVSEKKVGGVSRQEVSGRYTTIEVRYQKD